jgi:glyoxylase-like metal-dependent hydrolase (beta-lactamase superfamily II)
MNVVTAATPPLFKNGFLVSCEHTAEAVLIDPGDEVDELIAVARAQALAVRAILLTHAHFDHVTGVERAKRAFGVDVWLHPADRPLYDAAPAQAELFGFRMDPPPPVDVFYQPDTRFRFGRLIADVLATPGHCPGGVCLAIGPSDSEERELFVGDTLFAGSIGRTDLPGGNLDVLLRSIRDVLFAFPDETPVHPGHGPSTTIGAERRSNPFLVQ